MSYGVPVVAARVGGVPEVVRDGMDGLLADAGDAEGMAARVLRLLADDGLRRAMGESGRKRALEDFAEDGIVDQYLDVYQRA
jgi:glycosyltransferase involved in cell wall biosynthesis